MFHIALFEPEIPPNTGNIIRLAANTGCQLHLLEPLGFELDDKRLRRAGLDYSEWTRLQTHQNWARFRESMGDRRIFAATTRATRSYAEVEYRPGDVLLFGPETRGLPDSVLDELGPEHCLRIPMRAHSRSLNLSNSVAILVYEAWRQQQFTAGAGQEG